MSSEYYFKTLTNFDIKMKNFTFSNGDTKPGHICMVMIFHNDVFEVFSAEFQAVNNAVSIHRTLLFALNTGKAGFQLVYSDENT